MIINTANLTALKTAYSAAFKNAFEQAETMWQEIATEIPSSTAQNLYAWLGHFPSLREWLGDRHIKNMKASDYTLVNKPFESTVGVDRDEIEDDTYGVYSTLMADMGYAARVHPDELVFAKVASGATDLCYDGQAFFSASHPVIVNGAASTQTNYDTTGAGNLWVLLDTRRPLKPFIFQKRKDYQFQTFQNPNDANVFMNREFLYGVDARAAAGYGLWQLAYGSLNTLNATNVDAYMETMMDLKSDEDKPLGIKPNILLVGPSNYVKARNLVEKELISSGESNPHYKAFKIVLTPHLT